MLRKTRGDVELTELTPSISWELWMLQIRQLPASRQALATRPRHQCLSHAACLLKSANWRYIQPSASITQALPVSQGPAGLIMGFLGLNPEEQRALVLSTFAGLSTTIGAIFAVIKRPDDALLAFLLGTAIGVMFTLSVAEMWVHNALEHGWGPVTAAVAVGALLFRVIHPLLPDFNYEDVGAEKSLSDQGPNKESHQKGERTPLISGAEVTSATAVHERRGASLRRSDSAGGAAPAGSNGASSDAAGAAAGSPNPVGSPKAQDKDRGDRGQAAVPKGASKLRSGELLRLGLLMALTMTLHNLPEGMAVGFSAFTSFGPIMAAAIAVHNIPEGVIVAAPVFAATGSRWKALGIATASGLSEPLGALAALVVVRPFLTEERLQYILAFVGGIMACVCVLELWPEARKCRADRRLVAGVALGAAAMGWTLWVGV